MNIYDGRAKRAETVMNIYDRRAKRAETVTNMYDRRAKRAETVMNIYDRRAKRAETVTSIYDRRAKRAETVMSIYDRRARGAPKTPPGPPESFIFLRNFNDFPPHTEGQLKLIFCDCARCIGPLELQNRILHFPKEFQ